MFKAKGFTTKGFDPLTGKGSYFSPNGTRYYLDKGGMYKKGFEGPTLTFGITDILHLKK